MIKGAMRGTAAAAIIAAVLLVGCGTNTPEAKLASAKEYLAKDDPKAAVIELRSALQKNPNLGEARFLLGKTLLASGDAVGGEKELRKAKKSMPHDEELLRAAQSLNLSNFDQVYAALGRG